MAQAAEGNAAASTEWTLMNSGNGHMGKDYQEGWFTNSGSTKTLSDRLGPLQTFEEETELGTHTENFECERNGLPFSRPGWALRRSERPRAIRADRIQAAGVHCLGEGL